jgi:hypothetical protein
MPEPHAPEEYPQLLCAHPGTVPADDSETANTENFLSRFKLPHAQAGFC